jgi:antitoxin HicB
MMLHYRIKLEPDDNGTLLVTSPDLPGMVTFGSDRADAIRRATDAIEEWLASAISDSGDIPPPSFPARLNSDDAIVHLSALTSLKVELYKALYDAKVTRAELARRLNWNRESVDRLFRLNHASRLAQIEAAAHALQRSMKVGIY